MAGRTYKKPLKGIPPHHHIPQLLPKTEPQQPQQQQPQHPQQQPFFPERPCFEKVKSRDLDYCESFDQSFTSGGSSGLRLDGVCVKPEFYGSSMVEAGQESLSASPLHYSCDSGDTCNENFFGDFCRMESMPLDNHNTHNTHNDHNNDNKETELWMSEILRENENGKEVSLEEGYTRYYEDLLVAVLLGGQSEIKEVINRFWLEDEEVGGSFNNILKNVQYCDRRARILAAERQGLAFLKRIVLKYPVGYSQSQETQFLAGMASWLLLWVREAIETAVKSDLSVQIINLWSDFSKEVYYTAYQSVRN